jgi:hypothetical protein
MTATLRNAEELAANCVQQWETHGKNRVSAADSLMFSNGSEPYEVTISKAYLDCMKQLVLIAEEMDQQRTRANAIEAALNLINETKNVDVASLATRRNMPCVKCYFAISCGVAFDRYNLNTVAGIDCLAAK